LAAPQSAMHSHQPLTHLNVLSSPITVVVVLSLAAATPPSLQDSMPSSSTTTTHSPLQGDQDTTPSSSLAVGIDFGTSNTCVSYYNHPPPTKGQEKEAELGKSFGTVKTIPFVKSKKPNPVFTQLLPSVIQTFYSTTGSTSSSFKNYVNFKPLKFDVTIEEVDGVMSTLYKVHDITFDSSSSPSSTLSFSILAGNDCIVGDLDSRNTLTSFKRALCCPPSSSSDDDFVGQMPFSFLPSPHQSYIVTYPSKTTSPSSDDDHDDLPIVLAMPPEVYLTLYLKSVHSQTLEYLESYGKLLLTACVVFEQFSDAARCQ
jgi:hypothetical protein